MTPSIRGHLQTDIGTLDPLPPSLNVTLGKQNINTKMNFKDSTTVLKKYITK